MNPHFDSSRANSNQNQIPGSGGGKGLTVKPKLSTNDALSYLKEVKDKFQDQTEKYDMFLELLRDFKAQKIDTASVILKVKELFKEHNSLILGFNTFLPNGSEITLGEDDAPSKKKLKFEDAIGYVNKIKERFGSETHVFESFFEFLKMYLKELKTIGEIKCEVATLFKDHPDLIEDFTRFLPETSTSSSTQHDPSGPNSLQTSDEQRSSAPMVREYGCCWRRC